MARTTQSYSPQKTNSIISAAQNQFLSLGYSKTTMDGIARAANVSKQTLYNRYPDKQSLFFDVLKLYISTVSSGAADVPTHITSTVELQIALKDFANAVVATLGDPHYLGFMRVVLPELAAQPELRQMFNNNMPQKIVATLVGIIEAAQVTGIVRQLNSELAARMFAGSLLTYALQRGVLGNTTDILSPQEMDEVIMQFIDVIKI